jgi:hypothetical protein
MFISLERLFALLWLARGNMSPNQKYPKLDCHGFLERAFQWLKSGVEIELFYAALELRFTFEKLLIKHGNASTNYTKSFYKLHWQPKDMRNSLVNEFAPRLDIAKSYRFTLDPANPVLTLGYFLTIPEMLFVSYAQLNSYLLRSGQYICLRPLQLGILKHMLSYWTLPTS